MAQYDKTSFELQYNDGSAGKPFQTNTSRLITEAVLRQFAKDISDSFSYAVTGPNPDTSYTEFSDWIYSGPVPGGWSSNSSGVGAGIGADAYGRDTTENVNGEIYCETGTTSTGFATIYKGTAAIGLGKGDTFVFRMRAALETVSNGTDRYTAYIGFGDNISSGDQTDGVYFRYNDSVNSGKWQAVTRAATVETAADTGVTPNTLYNIFEVRVNSTATSATFYINDTLVQTITTNIPTAAGTNYTGLTMKIEKSLGTATRKFHSDWYSLLITRTSAR